MTKVALPYDFDALIIDNVLLFFSTIAVQSATGIPGIISFSKRKGHVSAVFFFLRSPHSHQFLKFVMSVKGLNGGSSCRYGTFSFGLLSVNVFFVVVKVSLFVGPDF